MNKHATWLGGPQDGEIVALPSDTKEVELRFFTNLPQSPEEELVTTKMRYPVKPGGPTGYRILYYEGVTSED